MKIILVILSIFLLTSCSDNLTNSKAKKILKECLEAEPYFAEVGIIEGDNKIYYKKDIGKLKLKVLNKLAKSGMIKFDSISSSRRYKYSTYKISLNEAAKKYFLRSKTSSIFYKNNKLKLMKAYDYEINDVIEVHETPSLNIAEVKVNFKKINITPFAILSNDSISELKIKKYTFTKTSNGWRYCE